MQRRYPIGAELQPGSGGVHFRVWAPAAHTLAVVARAAGQRQDVPPLVRPLARDDDGYFEALVPEAGTGSLYTFRFDDGLEVADPASRFQPDGPHGPSEVIDPGPFLWTDDAWRGPARETIVVSEIHIGTFTRQGTWRAALAELPALAEIGITALEVMPVADFPGEFGWGYDGVNLFAPTRLYGRPDDFRAFVDGAHALGLAVILDVVYNHFGPDGCWLDRFSPAYFSHHGTEWGQSINFDGEHARHVREFFIANAGYWVREFHVDGLRLDATHAIIDTSPVHIVRDIASAVSAAAGRRRTWVVGENEPQRSGFLRDETAGPPLDALWNDDFHHSAYVALTGRREAYFTDYFGTPQELLSAVKYGFLYQGQWYSWQKQRRGEPAFGLSHDRFVHFLENHDQIANSRRGLRRHALGSAGTVRALTALLLLGPATPLLFQGQEFAASAPFLFFADHHAELAALVRNGRREFLSQFPSLTHDPLDAFADPGARSTFERCKLDQSERERHKDAVALHRSLLALRSADPTFAARGAFGLDGAVLGARTFVLRFFGDPLAGPGAADRVLVVNLGPAIELPIIPEPLAAAPPGRSWSVHWSSEDVAYGGNGTPDLPLESRGNGGWRLAAESALVLAPVPESSQ